MNVDLHAVALVAAHRGRDNDQRLLADEIPNASLLLDVLVAAVGDEVELEGVDDAGEQQQAADCLQQRSRESHDRPLVATLCGEGWCFWWLRNRIEVLRRRPRREGNREREKY